MDYNNNEVNDMLEEHFTIKEVADKLHLHPRTIRRWIKAGRLAAVAFPGRFGTEYRIPGSGLATLGFKLEHNAQAD